MNNSKDLDKGNWEYNNYQKFYDPNMESKIKLSMKINTFNPKDINNYINPTLSRAEQINIKKNNNEKLKKDEIIILNNYLEKNKELLKMDINIINKCGIDAKPTTAEGKQMLLLYKLEYYLEKNNIDEIVDIYLKLIEKDFILIESLRKKYFKQLENMNTIINKLDIISLQFTKFYQNMPPLNNNTFTKLDEWQIKIIHNIDNNISTIIKAPTSAGKTIISGYATYIASKLNNKSLFIVPTDALAWQVASYVEHIINSVVPIVTKSHESIPYRKDMIELMNNSNCIVGTPEEILNYLPFIKNNFKWVIFDEIHLIGNEEGRAIIHIAKALPSVSFLALSATIGNIDIIYNFFKEINIHREIDIVSCEKRFFNLMKYYYDQKTNSLERINPLSLININDFKTNDIEKKQFNPTPLDIWDLYLVLSNKFKLNHNILPNNFFNKNKRIELDEAYDFFNKLILFMIDKFKTNPNDINDIINHFQKQNINVEDENIDLLKLAFKLKKESKTPSIIFQKNTVECMKMVRRFAKDVEIAENNKYPRLQQDRLKIEKQVKMNEKKQDQQKEMSDSKMMKMMMGKLKLKKDGYATSSIPKNNISDIEIVPIQEPHPDFIFNNYQVISAQMIEEWYNNLKKYFPNDGENYHYIIKLLWRGVGIYANNLPEPYLRLVQSLACNKQLAIVFSDMSLAYGVSMPFRTVVIYNVLNINDDLDSMVYHQMSGRAGRRGLDKEGNVIFVGYKWDTIKHLSTSSIPIINITNNNINTIYYAKEISKLMNTNYAWDSNNLHSNTLQNNNLQNNINYLTMLWKFRYNNDGIIVINIIPYLKRLFENKNHQIELNQIDIAYFLSRFFEIVENDNYDKINVDERLEYNVNLVIDSLKNENIIIPKNIDNRLYISILYNTLFKCNEKETEILRERLLKFSETIMIIQHFCYHSKIIGLTKILGKLLTRMWWIYNLSSPIQRSINSYFIDYDLHIPNI
jgi:superfamily II DNA or RNA helicase